jgi:hypothetical protein
MCALQRACARRSKNGGRRAAGQMLVRMVVEKRRGDGKRNRRMLVGK